MNLKSSGSVLVVSGVFALAGFSCAPERQPAGQSASEATAYSVALTAATSNALPKCTAALAGNVAYVASPAGLWRCAGGSWSEIKCSADQAGAVAYASLT